MFYFQRQVVFLYVIFKYHPRLGMSLNFVLTCYLQVGGREAKRVFSYVPSLSISSKGITSRFQKTSKSVITFPHSLMSGKWGGSRERENGSVILHLNCNGIHEPAGIINCEPLVTTTSVAAFERKRSERLARKVLFYNTQLSILCLMPNSLVHGPCHENRT